MDTETRTNPIGSAFCPKCGGQFKMQQVENVKRKYCERCGPHHIGVDVKSNEVVFIKR